MADTTVCIVFGNYLFDGRARRHVELLSESGNIKVLNLGIPSDASRALLPAKNAGYSIELINISRTRSGMAARHLALFVAALRFILKTKPRVVVALNYFTVYVALLRPFLRKTIFVYDAYELLITDASSTRREKFWFWLERIFISRFDLVIEANEERAELLRNFYKHKIQKVLSFRNIPAKIADNPAQDTDREEDARQLGIHPNAKVVLYQGDVTFDRDIGKFISALQYLPEDYQFLLIGDGPALTELKTRFKEFEKKGILIFTGRLQNDKLARYTRLAHAGIISYPFVGMNNLYCSPNKIYEYGQSGLAILSTAQFTMVNMINKYGIGELIGEHDDAAMISQHIIKIFSRIKDIRANLKRFTDENTWENETENYNRVLTTLRK